jgi:hypothetical protein
MPSHDYITADDAHKYLRNSLVLSVTGDMYNDGKIRGIDFNDFSNRNYSELYLEYYDEYIEQG